MNVFIIPIALTAVFLLVGCDTIPNDPTPMDDANATQAPFSVTYENGTLFYSVDITAPTPCHVPRADETILESYPVQVRIDVSLDPPAPDEMCAQVITQRTLTGRISIDHEPGRVTIVTPQGTHEVTL